MGLVEAMPSDVARKLGYYVYAYIDPFDGKIFYVGKGKGRRILSHLTESGETRKVATIKRIRAAGKQPQLEILAHDLGSADAALRVEAAVIDALGLPFLTNQVRGWRSSQYGRVPLEELIALYRRKPIRIREASVLIRVNELYKPQMSPSELYDVTRGVWRVSARRDRAKYAFAVFEGVVREVYEITRWLPAGSTFSSRDFRGVRSPGRWEFVGRLAPQNIRRRYVNRDVSKYFVSGSQNPISYVGIARD
jgi:hypothetical protein